MSSVPYPPLEALVALLRLERTGAYRFVGQSEDLGWGAVFGGHVLGQGLSAAAQTVSPTRPVHSFHAYFLRSGDVSRPISYEVEPIRDGASFATRRVVAEQGGKPIFTLAASFMVEEEGFAHADAMPAVPPPEELLSELDIARRHADRLPPLFQRIALVERPIEIRPVQFWNLLAPEVLPPRRQLWFRAAGALPDEPALHAWLLAYASDFNFLMTSLFPHGASWATPGMQVASLDHALWFHGPFRADEWLLFDVESPWAGRARGLVRGRIYTRDGRLVATAVQEGLLRNHALRGGGGPA